MTTFDTHALRLALRARLKTATGYPGDSKVAWENREFDPPDDGSVWLKESLVSGSDQVVSSGDKQRLGLYYIHVYGPTGGGTKAIEDLAKAIVHVFPAGTSLGSVHLYRTEPQAARIEAVTQAADSVWYAIPVVIYWRGYSSRL